MQKRLKRFSSRNVEPFVAKITHVWKCIVCQEISAKANLFPANMIHWNVLVKWFIRSHARFSGCWWFPVACIELLGLCVSSFSYTFRYCFVDYVEIFNSSTTFINIQSSHLKNLFTNIQIPSIAIWRIKHKHNTRRCHTKREAMFVHRSVRKHKMNVKKMCDTRNVEK